MTSLGALRGCAQPLANSYDVALLDLDGVVYIGDDAAPQAADALSAARAAGMRLAFVTNNASRTPETVAEHLTELEIAATPDEVITSSMAVARLLTAAVPAGARVLVVGGDGIRAEVQQAGFSIVSRADEDPAAVAQGLGMSTTWAELGEATLAVGRGLPWIAANLDLTLPTPDGVIPGNGALVRVIADITGRTPDVAGKPERPLHEEAIRRSGAKHPLVVGDRLDTDIEGAVRADTDSLFVLTGVTDVAALLRAGPAQRPTYIARDLRGLLMAHPDVIVDETTARCGSWRASRSGQALGLDDPEHGDGSALGEDRLDPLRALAGAAWAAEGADEGVELTIRGDAEVLAAIGLS